MSDDINQDILDKLTKVCVCKAISRSKIKDAIKAGSVTVEAVNAATCSGTGSCNGTRCASKIKQLIDQYLE